MEDFEDLTKLKCPNCNGEGGFQYSENPEDCDVCPLCFGSGLVDYKTYQKFNEAKK